MVAAARGRLMLWAPVFLGLGIGTYFALPAEPGAGVFAAGLAGLLGLVLLAVRGPEPGQVPAMALAWIVFGILLAGWRAHSVAAPVLGFRYYGPVEGRVIALKDGRLMFDGRPEAIDVARFREIYGEDAVEVEIR